MLSVPRVTSAILYESVQYPRAAQVQAATLPLDASCEAFEPAELQELQGLTFLNWCVGSSGNMGQCTSVLF